MGMQRYNLLFFNEQPSPGEVKFHVFLMIAVYFILPYEAASQQQLMAKHPLGNVV
jgi:hypothetical protein